MKKKIIGFMLVLCATMSLALCANAAEIVRNGTCGDNLTWTLDDEGTLRIEGEGEIIDWTYNSRAPWYAYYLDINKVIISNDITIIGDYAFYNCTALRSITIPDNVTSIGNAAFSGCIALTCITIPDSVTSIGSMAFNGCSNLTDITISNSLTYIGRGAFWNTVYYKNNDNWEGNFLYINDYLIDASENTTVTSYTVKDGTVLIADDAFLSCLSIVDVYLPASLEYLEPTSFIGMHDITRTLKIHVDEANEYYSDIDGVLFNKDKTELIRYAQDGMNTKYIIPDGVTKISDYAFYECDLLEELIIPYGVTELNGSFFLTWNLRKLYLPSSIRSVAARGVGYSSVTDVYYGGTLEEWESVNLSDVSIIRCDAQIHPNAIGTAPPRFRNAEFFLPTASAPASVAVTLGDTEYDSEMITVFYKDGVMVDMVTTPVSAGDADKSVPVTAADADTAKVFIWSSLDSMKPLCGAETVDLNNE